MDASSSAACLGMTTRNCCTIELPVFSSSDLLPVWHEVKLFPTASAPCSSDAAPWNQSN